MESLGLDIKLLLAQIINFAILFVVLKKLLFGPLANMLDDRNKKLDSSLLNSQKIEEKLNKIEEKEKSLLDKAKLKAKSEREELLSIAESEKSKIIDDAKAAASKEVQKGIENIKMAENEAIKSITDKYIDEIVEKLTKKLTANAKKENFPMTRKLLK